MVWNLRWCSDPSRRNPSLALWRTIAASVRTSFLRRYTNSLGVLWSWGDCQKAEGRKGWKGTNSVETNVLSSIQRKANTAAIFWDGWNRCDVTANNMSKPRNLKKCLVQIYLRKNGGGLREKCFVEKNICWLEWLVTSLQTRPTILLFVFIFIYERKMGGAQDRNVS